MSLKSISPDQPHPLPNLVVDFSDSAYPHVYSEPFENWLDPSSRLALRKQFERAVALADITDFRLLETNHQLELRLTNAEDYDFFTTAFHMEEGPVTDDFNQKFEGCDSRILRAKKNEFQKIVKNASLQDKVRITIHQKTRCMYVDTDDVKIYLQFRRLIGPHLAEPYL